jgi:hypothetical protein
MKIGIRADLVGDDCREKKNWEKIAFGCGTLG